MILPINTAFAKHPTLGLLAPLNPLPQPQTPNPAQVFHRLSRSCKQFQPSTRVFLLLPVALFTIYVQHKRWHFVWDFFSLVFLTGEPLSLKQMLWGPIIVLSCQRQNKKLCPDHAEQMTIMRGCSRPNDRAS